VALSLIYVPTSVSSLQGAIMQNGCWPSLYRDVYHLNDRLGHSEFIPVWFCMAILMMPVTSFVKHFWPESCVCHDVKWLVLPWVCGVPGCWDWHGAHCCDSYYVWPGLKPQAWIRQFECLKQLHARGQYQFVYILGSNVAITTGVMGQSGFNFKVNLTLFWKSMAITSLC